MTRSAIIMWLPMVAQVLFVGAIGACIGSLTNVLAYRMPRGLGVVVPSSRCPSCQTKLTWRENIPIFGWILLRGRCRFCDVRVSAEYPIVEAFVALLFAGFFSLWYLVPDDAVWFGLEVGRIGPVWTRNGLGTTWPALVVLLTLLGSLTAMTIIDARTFTIPLVLTWVPAGVAAVVHTVHAGWLEWSIGTLHEIRPGSYLGSGGGRWITTPDWTWTLATPSPAQWGWIGAGLGGVLGIGCSLLLQRLGLIRRSFADYETWEAGAIAEAEAERAASPSAPAEADNATTLWIQYPHARREMVIETAFASPIVIGMIAGGWFTPGIVAAIAGPWTHDPLGGPGMLPPVLAPLWLTVLGGVCLGYLIGGGVVWLVRILGSIVFNKEAMGMGDVHLMAAVGASLGWIDAVIGFFGAAFVGVAYTIAALVVGGKLKRAMPFGPFLAVSTVLVLLCKPQIENMITTMLHAAHTVHLP